MEAPGPGAPDWARVERIDWVRPRALVPRWVLSVDGEEIAVLRCPHWWSPSLVAEGALGEWRVRVSWWGRHVVVGPDGGQAVRTAWRGLRSVTLERNEEGPLVFRSLGLFDRHHVIETTERLPLIHFRRGPGPFTRRHTVALEDAARSLPDLVALLVAGWALTLAESRAHRH